MSDLATLGIRVDASGAIQDIQRLDAALIKVTSTADQSVQYVRGLAQASTDAGRRMALMEIEAYKMDAAMRAMNATAGQQAISMNRVRESVTSMAASMVGAAPGVTQLTSVLGAQALGSGLMIGVLAGVAALTAAYNHLTESARAAKKQAQETLDEFRQIERMDFAGQAKRAGELYSGTGRVSDGLAGGGIVGALREQARLQAEIAAGTVTLTSRTGQPYRQLTDDAKAAAEQLKVVNKWLDENQKVYISTYGVNGKGGSLQRAAAELVASQQPAFITDAQRTQQKQAEKDTKDHIQAVVDAINERNRIHKQLDDAQNAEARAGLAQLLKDQEDEQDASNKAVADGINTRNRIRKQLDDEQNADARAGLAQMLAAERAFAREQAQVASAIRDNLLGAVLDLTSQGTVSWERFMNTMARQSVHMVEQVSGSLERLQAQFQDALERGDDGLAKSISDRMAGLEKLQKAIGVGAIAATAGTSGYNIGSASSSGNRGSSALFGALSGAASGAAIGNVVPGIGTAVGAAVGSIAGFVGGILGAGHAADLSAHEMENLRKSLATSIADVRATLANDKLSSALAQVHSQFEALRKAAEDAYAYGKNEAERNTKLAELNDLEEQRIKQIKDEAALLQVQAQEDYKIRKLVAEGHQEEADALAFAEQQQREYNAAVKDSADATTLAALAEAQAAEAKKHAEDVAKAAAEKVRQQQREEEDANLRLMKAQSDPAYDAAARAAQERIEIEDLIARGASEATIALTKQAQAAEDLAKAAADAAAAQQKQLEQARAMQDLDVEILNAKGETGKAADLQFQLEQQRRLEDAQKNQSEEYVKKLLELQQLQRDSRAAQQLIESTGSGGAGGRGATGASSAYAAVTATVTERTAYQLVDVGRAQLTELRGIRRELVAIRGGRSTDDAASGFVSADLFAGSVSR